MLSLPIPNNKNISLDDCLNEFLKIENLNENNKYYNENLKKYVNASKQLIITNYPKYLFITLKRFNNLEHKIDSDININLNWNINDNQYNLIGFVIHFGTLDFGHYISCIYRNNKWYLCDDNNILECNDINNFLKKSYILLFKKIS